jgi:hypothetical protein
MAVTAHWLELVPTQGGEKTLTLRANLIGFLHLPGTHTGERLAELFYFIIARMGLLKKVMSTLFYLNLAYLFIYFKIGWVTTDNASNNFTMMNALETQLKKQDRNTDFSGSKRHIKYVFNYLSVFFC